MASKKILFLLLITGISTAMERSPQLLLMKKNDTQSHILKDKKKFSCADADCLDCFKWSEFILNLHPAPQKSHPLMRNDDVPCCGEGCDIAMKCIGSSLFLCAPQTFLFSALKIVIGNYQKISCVPTPIDDVNTLAAVGTVGICSCVILRNTLLKQKTD